MSTAEALGAAYRNRRSDGAAGSRPFTAGRSPVGPRACRGDGAHGTVRRLVQVVRHLHRQDAARRTGCRTAAAAALMVRQPLQHRIGEDQVHRLRRRPGGDVGLLEPIPGRRSGAPPRPSRATNRCRARVAAGKRSTNNSVELPGPHPRSTTREPAPRWHATQQVPRGSRPLVFEAAVERRVPVRQHHVSRPRRHDLAAAALPILVRDHGDDDDDALHDSLDIGVDPDEGEAARHHAEDQRADHRAGDPPRTARKADAADHGGRDGVELIAEPHAGLAALRPRRRDEAGQPGQQPASV